MLVLGIIDSKPSAAALLEDGRILAAVAEERLCRMKMASGMPRSAISKVLEIAGVTAGDVERVAVAQEVSVFSPQPVPWTGWFDDEEESRGLHRRLEAFSAAAAPVLGRFPLAWRSHHALKRLLSRRRLTAIRELLRADCGMLAPVGFHDHHFCHATTAYYTSGFERALVVTLDGGGDARSGSVYLGEDGRLDLLSSVDSFNSLGNFYSYVTELCGFRAEKHEGKITGLAAYGKPTYADALRRFIRYQDPGRIRYTVPMYHGSALRLLRDGLPPDFDRADLAASVQLVLEEIGVAFVRYWLRRTGSRNLAIAGGVFANVRFNQTLHELPEVENLFIFPAMDDSGLAVGSALAATAEATDRDPRRLCGHLDNVYLGPAYHGEAIGELVSELGLEIRREPHIHRRIAELLAAGRVVARFTGRMEYGPRALGHRSILYQTTDPSVNDWLNEALERTEFMPFAPATLAKHASQCYENLAGAANPARFMTITFQCTPEMKRQSPGVVHLDGTARPQIVDADSAPDFYHILHHYHELTGIPSLINTSFNMHEEPIVHTPDDAVRAFDQADLDYLALDDFLICRPTVASAEHRRARRAEPYLPTTGGA